MLCDVVCFCASAMNDNNHGGACTLLHGHVFAGPFLVIIRPQLYYRQCVTAVASGW